MPQEKEYPNKTSLPRIQTCTVQGSFLYPLSVVALSSQSLSHPYPSSFYIVKAFFTKFALLHGGQPTHTT